MTCMIVVKGKRLLCSPLEANGRADTQCTTLVTSGRGSSSYEEAGSDLAGATVMVIDACTWVSKSNGKELEAGVELK